MCTFIYKEAGKARLYGERVAPNMFAPEASAHPTGIPEEGMVCQFWCQVRQELAFGVFVSAGCWDAHWERVQPWPGNSLPAGNSQCALATDNTLCSQDAMAQKSILVSTTPDYCIFLLSPERYTHAFCLQLWMSFSTILLIFDICWQCQEKGCMNMFIFLYIWLSKQRVLAPGWKDDWILTLKIETFRKITRFTFLELFVYHPGWWSRDRFLFSVENFWICL